MFRSEFLGSLGGATTVAQFGLQQITPSISIALCAPLSGPAKPIGTRLQLGANAAIQYAMPHAGSFCAIAAKVSLAFSYQKEWSIATALLNCG